MRRALRKPGRRRAVAQRAMAKAAERPARQRRAEERAAALRRRQERMREREVKVAARKAERRKGDRGIATKLLLMSHDARRAERACNFAELCPAHARDAHARRACVRRACFVDLPDDDTVDTPLLDVPVVDEAANTPLPYDADDAIVLLRDALGQWSVLRDAERRAWTLLCAASRRTPVDVLVAVPGRGTITITTPRHCTAAQFKRLVEEKTHIAAAQQRLYTGDRELPDARTVPTAHAGANLRVVLDLCGGMEPGDDPPFYPPLKRCRAAAAAAEAPPMPPTPQKSHGEGSDADDGGDRDSGVGAAEVSAAMTAEQAAAADPLVVALQLLLHVASPGHGAERF